MGFRHFPPLPFFLSTVLNVQPYQVKPVSSLPGLDDNYDADDDDDDDDDGLWPSHPVIDSVFLVRFLTRPTYHLETGDCKQ